MSFRTLRPLFVATLLAALPALSRAQQKPTPAEAQLLLQTRPDLVKQLQDKIGTSGMTLDQIHARLRAEGYPEDMLDAYYPGSRTTATASDVNQGVFSAVESLGIVDSLEADSLRQLAGFRPRIAPRRRSLRRARVRAPSGPIDTRIDTTANLPDSVRRRLHLPMPDTMAVEDSLTEDSLPIFGLDVFQNETSQFDANLAGPVDDNYTLGPGDRLVLVLTGDVEQSYTLDVTRQGFIVVPQVGEIDVANLTLGQLREVLYTRLGRVYSGVRRGAGATTHFSISPARLRTNQVYVIGDVTTPGSYRISAAGTALTALYAAMGPTDVGSLRRIEIRRGTTVVDTLDVYDYLLRGDASHDPRLQNGDVVFVPPHGPQVTVTGEVLRPAIYEMKPSETLADLVRDAGGFSASADRRRLQIERVVPPSQRTEAGRDRIVMDVTSSQLEAGGPALAMVDGDVVTVFGVHDRVAHRVTVDGNVYAPGTVGFRPGMRVSDALRLAGGLKPDSYLGQVLVARLRSDSPRIQLRTALRDTTGAAVNDFALADDDEIRVFSETEFRPTQYVAITGAVRRSGRYPYREGMTIRDLVLLAGGLQEKAALAAEIARLPEVRSGGQLATTMKIGLDSSYLFGDRPTGMIAQAGAPRGGAQPNDPVLQPYDNVLILEQPEWGLQRTVAVAGEVMSPGVYSLKAKGDRLSDVLQRAGGLTREGNADGVVFYRKRGALGRVGIDLTRVLKNQNDRDNLVLQDGDSIYIPAYAAIVNVTGAVNSPVAVAYVPGKNIDYYIDAAGGLAPKAELSRAYVTQPNGKVQSRKSHFLIPDSKPKPRAGSVVVVPLKDPTEKKDYTPLLTASVQILASLLAIAAVMKR